jgi:hypothetical protein
MMDFLFVIVSTLAIVCTLYILIENHKIKKDIHLLEKRRKSL